MAVDTNIMIKQNEYEKTRRRVSRFKNQFNISDKEIIEYLAEEIEYYRNKIGKQEEYIKELQNKTTVLDLRDNKTELQEIEEIEDNDIKEIETINTFADGKLIQTITKYKYREE